jgi:hypothetical protein
MLVTLAELKDYLGITGSGDDSWLTQQATLISDTIDSYCGRKFLEDDYIQTYYPDDYAGECVKELTAFHYPVSDLAQALDGDLDITADIRLQKELGNFKLPESEFFSTGEEVEIQYTAGFPVDEVPTPIKNVVFVLVEERYNKKQAGVSLSFGSDVQRVSIPGTISIDFDYSLQSNERKTAFGTILGNHVNVLDYYRSERAIVGSGKITYVEVGP